MTRQVELSSVIGVIQSKIILYSSVTRILKSAAPNVRQSTRLPTDIRMFEKLIKRAISMKQAQLAWRTFYFAIHGIVFALSGVLAFQLRFEFAIEPRYQLYFIPALLIWISVKLLTFGLGRFDREEWSQVSASDITRITGANIAASGFSTITLLVMFHGFPRSLFVLDFMICLQATIGLRAVARIVRELTVRSIGRGLRKRILIYGAGAGGVMLLRELRANSLSTHEVCGFIDDDPRKQGMLINRVAVLGSGQDLAEQTRRKGVAEVLIAIPSARGPQMAQILEHCHTAGAPCKTMPGLAEFVVSARAASQIRDVAVEDLLGRNPVHLDEETIRHKLEGRTILVTGAGGSIGSELCLQIARFRPQTVVGLDIAESALFNIQQELTRLFPELHFCPEIGSIRNNQRIYEVFRKYKPSTVYHAAAYKHVPLMEEHPFEAVENNVFGTWQIATMAGKFRVDNFVMISSDKAVRPTSIMGATKRTAELIIYAIQNGGTKYMSVRFGNVLGSNGSVIPTFKKQIAVGGPVIVTHPEMRRYFMTIPEATQLVLQASTMGSGGEIFELEMGEQVKIADLAKNLILLSGLRPGEDVKITFTRPRPGEKLYEELSSHDEHTIPTYHEKIKILIGNGIPNQFLTNLQTLKQSCESRNMCNLVMKLKEIVPEYNPGSHLLRNILANDEHSRISVAELAEL